MRAIRFNSTTLFVNQANDTSSGSLEIETLGVDKTVWITRDLPQPEANDFEQMDEAP